MIKKLSIAILAISVQAIAAYPGIAESREKTGSSVATDATPCAVYVQAHSEPPDLRCQPIQVQVTHVAELQILDVLQIPVCQIPGAPHRYLSQYYIFNYTVESRGELVLHGDFERFHIVAPMGAAPVTILQAEGFIQDWEISPDGKCQLVRYVDEVLGIDPRYPQISLLIGHPAKTERSNIHFTPVVMRVQNLEVTCDEQFRYGSLDVQPGLAVDADITPAMVREFLQSGSLSKTLTWTINMGEKGVQTNTLIIEISREARDTLQ